MAGGLELVLTVPDDASATGFTRLQMMGTQEKPLLAANDVGAILGHSNIRKAMAGLDDDEKGVTERYTPGGKQRIAVVNEAGLYKLIFTSRIPAAKRFQRWVVWEVLPTIRRHGCYPAPAAKAKGGLTDAGWVEGLLTVVADGQKLIASQMVQQTSILTQQAAMMHTLLGMVDRVQQPTPAAPAKATSNRHADKERAARAELLADPTRTDSLIAEACVAGHAVHICAATVARYREKMEAAGEIGPNPVRVDRNGKRVMVRNQFAFRRPAASAN
jgi:prophage antirepressor-like protein